MDDRITVGLVARTAQFGRGLAYRTRDAIHRLNVTAANMCAYSEDIGGFYHWLQSRPERLRAVGIHTLHPNAFVPRMLFGEYLEDLLAEAETVTPSLQKIADEAVDLVPLLNGSFFIVSFAPPPLIF